MVAGGDRFVYSLATNEGGSLKFYWIKHLVYWQPQMRVLESAHWVFSRNLERSIYPCPLGDPRGFTANCPYRLLYRGE